MAATGSVNFGGVISGLDTNKLIEDLIKVDSQPLTRLETQKTDLTEKRDTYTTMKTNLLDLQTKAEQLKTASSFGSFSASSSDEEALTVKASSSANEGNYTVKILALAQAETLSGDSYSKSDTDLGLSGELLINNKSLKIKTTDSLTDIKNAINSLNAGVTASILKVTDTDNRLIITSNTRGTDGFRIANIGSNDIAGALGLTDSTKSIREIENGAVLSDSFTSANSTLGSLINISTKASGTIEIRNKSVAIDLATDTLSTIRDKINDLKLNGVTASVVSVDDKGSTKYRLAITGTEDFTDAGNVLETIGILERGTSGTHAEYKTSTLYISNGSNSLSEEEEKKSSSDSANDSSVAKSTTNLTKIGAKTGETITISGKKADGTSVSKTISISNSSKVSDVLSAIEETYDGEVTATIENGAIKVTSNIAGSNNLSFSIRASNQNGGELDFGSVVTVTKGRDRKLVEGSDAELLVNNVKVSRNTNEVSDVLTGLTLSLKKADVGTELNIAVQRDRDSIKTKIEDFVKSYNTYVDYVNSNSTYNEETKEAGPLLGDITSRTVGTRLGNALRSTVYDDDFEYSQLIEIGIETDTKGKLTINSSKLTDALTENVDSVISLFSATRKSSDNDIQLVYHSSKTSAGTYAVNITQAAEQATVESDIIAGAVGTEGRLAVTDNFGNTVNVAYTNDMTIDDIANAFNEDAKKAYTAIVRSDTALVSGDKDSPLSQNSALEDIAGVTVKTGDTVTINATTHTGKTFQRVLTVTEGKSIAVSDILDAIESMNSNQATASIDSEGRLVIEDSASGSSKLAVSISTTIDGLDFGTFGTIQQGRSTASLRAQVTNDNRISIVHEEYGSQKSFTVSGAEKLGIADGTYKGVDVAGTINGTTGVGNGQTLTVPDSDANARGIVIRVNLTAEELAQEGSDQGSVTLIAGIADKLYSELSTMTGSVDGFVQSKINSVNTSIKSLNDRIDSMNKRIELRRQNYVRKFTELERSMAKLQSIQQTLSSALGGSSSSLFSSLS